MTTPPAPPRSPLAHHAVRMGGRDPHEAHRASTPLELLFDLTFVIAFGLAAAQFAHLLAEGIATGAGLHVAAYYIDHKAHIGAVATVLTVAVPVSVYVLMIYWLYTYLLRQGDRFHLWLLAGTAIVLAASVVAAMAGIDMAVCLIILMLAPIVTVVGYEIVGHRHKMVAIARALGEPP